MFGRRKRIKQLERQVQAQQAEIAQLREELRSVQAPSPRNTHVEVRVRKRDAFWVSFWWGFFQGLKR
ncbi:hypothetical protein [Sphaerobacter sp.]|uniref:hypothetical protein n=1 Tax=Sphaerobacter sp. TaxID=2099654 RepID=UPI001E036196|nr:hypothetical protein [Sphaerobacter sp.]MBX5444133.1 hypothetical protein [Sphaerobacter sp.]